MEKKNTFLDFFKSTIYFLSFFVSFFIFTVTTASAATLYFSPASGKFGVGSTFTVSVFTNTQNEAINSAEATIHFPADLLTAVSTSQTGSIFSLWVQPAAISNSDGVVTFNGGLPTPGYTGASGKIFSTVFKVKKPGTASLRFSSASVRANDGKGTNILSGSGTAQFTLGESAPAEPGKPAPIKSNTPTAPEISSPTHPDPTKWYSTNDSRLTWTVPSGITQIRTLLGKTPTATPTVTHASLISSIEIEDIEDGQWYFHVQFRNANGWGQVGHFPIKIDTQRPILEFSEIQREECAPSKATFSITSSDALSGIDRYEIQIDKEQPKTWIDDGSHVYKTGSLSSGRHTLFVKVFDKAGNSVADSIEFNVVGDNRSRNLLTAVIVLSVLVLFLLLLLGYTLYKYEQLKAKLKKRNKTG